MNLGEQIYQLRTARNLSQGDLADALDVSRQSVSKWENNMAVPDLDKLLKMSELFGITLDELVTGNPPTAPAEPASTSFPTLEILALFLFAIGAITLLVTMLFGNSMGLHSDVGPMLCLEFVLAGVALLNRDNRMLVLCLLQFAIPVLFLIAVFTFVGFYLPLRLLFFFLGYVVILLVWWLYQHWSPGEG